MGGKYMPAPPPSSSYKIDPRTQQQLWVEAWTRQLDKLIRDEFFLNVECMRDLARDAYRIIVRVHTPDWGVHGTLDETVHDLQEFPSETFKTQLIMLAG